jgi:hypothetical protein
MHFYWSSIFYQILLLVCKIVEWSNVIINDLFIYLLLFLYICLYCWMKQCDNQWLNHILITVFVCLSLQPYMLILSLIVRIVTVYCQCVRWYIFFKTHSNIDICDMSVCELVQICSMVQRKTKIFMWMFVVWCVKLSFLFVLFVEGYLVCSVFIFSLNCLLFSRTRFIIFFTWHCHLVTIQLSCNYLYSSKITVLQFVGRP